MPTVNEPHRERRLHVLFVPLDHDRLPRKGSCRAGTRGKHTGNINVGANNRGPVRAGLAYDASGFRVSEEQIERIQERRARIKDLLNDLGESLRLVRDLHKSSEVREVWIARNLCLLSVCDERAAVSRVSCLCLSYAEMFSPCRRRDVC